jgi:membrane-associated protein
MGLISTVIEIFLHLDVHLNEAIGSFGPWIYLILFLIIFCETGLVVMPFLPGDSLLFALGALAATDNAVLEYRILAITLVSAAILGDNLNYVVGRTIGPKIFSRDDSRWFHRRHLLETENFYEKHGGKTLILAKFLPIVRTFAPFVAGIGRMKYFRFVSYNVFGGLFWVLLLLSAGYYLGNIPTLKKNFELVVISIIVLSLSPLIIRSLKRAPKVNGG